MKTETKDTLPHPSNQATNRRNTHKTVSFFVHDTNLIYNKKE